jgi:hypothetical protein
MTMRGQGRAEQSCHVLVRIRKIGLEDPWSGHDGRLICTGATRVSLEDKT